MTIGKGTSWGDPVLAEVAEGLVDRLVTATDDAGLARAVAGSPDGSSDVVAEVGAGDVWRTLGLTVARSGSDRLLFPFDLGFVSLDGLAPVPFVAHLCARRRFWSGSFAVVMNCAWMGEWYLGPRAHPNDGLLDITVGSLPLGQRMVARRRARTGSHLPHPGLETRRSDRWEHRFDRPVSIYLDGRRVGRHRHLSVRVAPDHFQLLA